MSAPGEAPRIVGLFRSGGGVPKVAVDEAEVGADGLAGDWQADREHHGGPERALCLFAIERIEALRAEGHPISPGTTGENVTIAGLDWAKMVPGAQLELGSALVTVSSFAPPCSTIEASFVGGAFVRISEKVHPGWSRVYARVDRGGRVRVGDRVVVLVSRA